MLFLLNKGMNENAWKIIEGMYDLLYNKLGLAFQTPEALFKTNVYRSLGYILCFMLRLYFMLFYIF